jgi:hypothetical protein
VLEQRYLFVLGQLALFVSDELVHQLHETHLRDWVSPPMRIIVDRWISGQLLLRFRKTHSRHLGTARWQPVLLFSCNLGFTSLISELLPYTQTR